VEEKKKRSLAPSITDPVCNLGESPGNHQAGFIKAIKAPVHSKFSGHITASNKSGGAISLGSEALCQSGYARQHDLILVKPPVLAQGGSAEKGDVRGECP